MNHAADHGPNGTTSMKAPISSRAFKSSEILQ